MRRSLPALSIVFLILLILAGGILGWREYGDYQSKQRIIHSFGEYYRGLARECYKRENVDCCLSSVSTMEARKHPLIGENGCQTWTRSETLKCQDSYTWCEIKTEEGAVK